MERTKRSYGLTDEAQHKILREFHARGYGYSDYPGQSGYGIATVSRSRMAEMVRRVGGWHETLFMEHGWDDHHDVCVCAMQKPGKLEP
jgi:hypothetical protein